MSIFLSDKDYAVWERKFETEAVALETFLNKLDKIPVVNYVSASSRLGIGVASLIASSIYIVVAVIQGGITKHSLNLKDRIIKHIAYTDHAIANIIRATVIGVLWMAPFGLMADPQAVHLIFSAIVGYVVCIIYDLQGWRFRYPIEKLTLEQRSLSLERA